MTKKIQLQPKEVITWTVIALLTFIFAKARVCGQISTFAISLFVGLSYAGKNIIILTPILLLAMVVSDPRWQTVVVALTVATVFFIAFCVHRKFKKKLKPLYAVLYTVLGEIPLFFIYGLSLDNTLWAFVNCTVSSLFACCCIIVGYLFFVKGLKYKLITSEKISLGFFILVSSLGLYNIQISSVYLGAVVFSLFAVFAVYFYGESGVISVMISGLAPVLANGNISGFLFCSAVGIILLCTRKYRRINFLAIPVLDLLFGYAFKLFPDYSFINAILLFVGGLIFALLPNKFINRYLSTIGADRGYAVRTLVNRNRYDIYKRLNRISAVLKDMSLVLKSDEEPLGEVDENKEFLAVQLADAVCSDCNKRAECEKMLTASTKSTTYDLINNCMKSGRISILELPPFMSEYCSRSVKMLSGCKEMLENYTVKKELSDSVLACKTLMCEQIDGLSGMIDSFSKEIKQTVSFDSAKEKELIDSLSSVNVIASEAVVYAGTGTNNLVLTVRSEDENKPALMRIVNKVMGNMVKSDRTASAGSVSLSFVNAPKLDFMLGTAQANKTGSKISGDTHTIVKLSPEKVMIALSDGMGSGENANSVSDRAIGLVESFYKAGIDENIVLSLINKLLSIRGREDFSCIDMCILNLRSGICDFIKLGGVESIISHKNSVEVIEGGALPMGILETIKPCVCRRQISAGDMIIMFSDGITDSIGSDGVIRITEQNNTSNPEKLAKEIIEDSDFVGHDDDKTVLCIKIFNRI